jgi:SAM-dependent methyltransferase
MNLRSVIDPLLEFPILYELSQRMLGASRSHTVFMRDHVRAGKTESLLDIGCGVGASLSHLTSENRYLGIDINSTYIARAQGKYVSRTFICSDVVNLDLSGHDPFSCAFAYGVLHHLDSDAANRMFDIVARNVTDRFVTIDPVIRQNDHPIARYLVSQDRGRFVRTESEYLSIARQYGVVKSTILTDLLRVPYSHMVMSLSFGSPTSEGRPGPLSI